MLDRAFAHITRLRRALRTPLRVPGITVVSIGGLRVGGVGKSPVARAVCEVYRREGLRAVIVMRGYGGRARGPVCVSSGDHPEEVGDEALEHSALGHEVIVARERARGVALARALGFQVAVLDDGFQHIALARDLDLVLLARSDLDARVLPLGPLREPLTALLHADLLASQDPSLREFQGRRVHTLKISLGGLTDRRGASHPMEGFTAQRALVVSSIARPERVVESLHTAGLKVIELRAFRDHHAFGPEALVAPTGVDLVVVTGKDAARGVFTLNSSEDLYATDLQTELPEALSEHLLALSVLQRETTLR